MANAFVPVSVVLAIKPGHHITDNIYKDYCCYIGLSNDCQHSNLFINNSSEKNQHKFGNREINVIPLNPKIRHPESAILHTLRSLYPL